MIPRARLFLFTVFLITRCYAGEMRSRWRAYHNPDYGFSIGYPASMTFYSGRTDDGGAQLSYIPICDFSTVACFEYNGREYEGTNFEAAGISINVLRDLRNEQACDDIDSGSAPRGTKEINGIKFHWGMTGDAGLGHSEGGTTYRVFHQNVCFEIVAATAQSSIGAFEPGTVKTFDAGKLDSLLKDMVHTFKFEGDVRDGSGWKVYYDNMCGGIYEYPDDATIKTAIEYSQEGYYSNEITCSRSFMYKDRIYKVEAKVNLRDREHFEIWLKSSTYPALTKAQLVASSKYFSQYRAGPYYYIFGQATAYILSVSDAKGEVINPDNDPVFKHLFNSFKVY